MCGIAKRPPAERVGAAVLIEMTPLMERPPRRNANLRRTPEQKKREEERQRRSEAALEKSPFPSVAHLPKSMPFGSI